MSSQHNMGAYHEPGEAHTWCQLKRLGSIHSRVLIWQVQLFPVQETFQLDLLVVTKLFCSLSLFFPFILVSISPPFFLSSHPSLLSAGPGVYLGAMGKVEANNSQWLLISTICSALDPLISERKSNMWRESDRQKLRRTNRAIVCWRSAFKHEGPSKSLPLPRSLSLSHYKMCTYLCVAVNYCC